MLEPLLPACPLLGRPPIWGCREIIAALLDILRGGLLWQMLPPDVFAPMTTVQPYFKPWRDSGLWSSINHTLLRGRAKRQARKPRRWQALLTARASKPQKAPAREGLMRVNCDNQMVALRTRDASATS